jgi:hypothetical protein
MRNKSAVSALMIHVYSFKYILLSNIFDDRRDGYRASKLQIRK